METTKFDIADYLDSSEMIAEYLNVVLAEGNDSDVITAIGHIAKSIGMTKIAQETGLSRPSLYKALSDGSKPQFETIMKVLKSNRRTDTNEYKDGLKTNAPQHPLYQALQHWVRLVQFQMLAHRYSGNRYQQAKNPSSIIIKMIKKKDYFCRTKF